MADTCSICLEEIKSQKFELPCKHKFHIFCFAKYVISNHWNGEDNAYKDTDKSNEINKNTIM